MLRSGGNWTAPRLRSPAWRPTARGRGQQARPGSDRILQEALSLRDSSTQNVLSTQYDAQVLNKFFRERPWLVIGRVLDVTKQALLLFLKLKLSGKDVSLAGEISGFLSRAGPTFVKLGQTLSTREDLVGKDVARALADLQMAAPPFPDPVAMDLIAVELGGLPAEVFDTFSQRYVAAASMGQVYKATLRSSGEAVAVKVQRPDLLGSIALDVYVLRLSLGAVRFLAKINSDIRNIADEVGRGLFAELDYTVEAKQAKIFSEAHAHLHFTDAVKVFPQFSSKRVLTTLWVDGSSPNDLLLQCEALPRDSLEYQALRARLVHMINLGIESSLTQLLLTGILHGDPHPGNLILTHDNRLVYLDFGLITFVPPKAREAMMGCLVHVALGKWRAMADDLDAMGFLKEKIDKDDLAAALEVEVSQVWPLAGSFGANSFLADGSAQTGGALAARLADGRVRPELGLGQGLTFGKLAKAIIKLAIQFRFRLPPYYTLIVRSLCSLEGIALRVDPDFSIVNAAIPIILRRMLTDTRPGAVTLLRELLLEEDKRLRIGMLEGLLRNYSIEAGKGAASQSSASGVVLKHAGTVAKSMAPEVYTYEAISTSGAARSGNDAIHGAGRNGALGVANRHDCADDDVGNGSTFDSTAVAAGSNSTADQARSDAISMSTASGGRAESEQAHSPKGVCTLSEPNLSPMVTTAVASHPRSGEVAPCVSSGSDLIGSVVQMVLSAKAAGVRKVVLEASMKDVVESISSKECSGLRAEIVDLLSRVVTWSTLLRGLAICIAVVFKSLLSMCIRIFRWHRHGSRRGLRLFNIKQGTTVRNVYLDRIALKRLQLGALVAVHRLWKESRWTTICSVFLAIRLIFAALFKRGHADTH
eukprot:jgi/Ulvmu1/5164/UM021_0181.1